MKTLFTSVLVFGAFVSFSAFAAPIPGTATSKLVSPQIGLYHSPLGFQLNAGSSGWAHAAPPKNNKYIATVYRAAEPGSVADRMRADLHSQGNVVNGGKAVAAAKTVKPSSAPATLTVRVDKLEKDTTLDRYIGKWMKEYPRYGFDVLGSKPFLQAKNKGYVLDLVNRNQGKQLRQVVFLKRKNAVILTCRDRIATFQTSLKACNQIIKTFTW
jgi:hypothetical protein